MFQSEFAPYTIQCEKIGRLLIDKTAGSNLTEWFEGNDLDKYKSELSEFESDIDKSELEVTYYLSLMSENPLIYAFDFRNAETETPFGQIYIRFINRENILVDDIKIITKSKMDEIESESDNSELPKLPPPPKPPKEKKKSGN
ncbi:hypothetical protein [Winogradskyella sp.]|uniref:hypothetical protein n=1 Tax=Winogradskyella sp. TaxID=1883156 RepID=UPI0026158AD5|nr:hypothetical protein [Winogradskyella sp.]